MRNILSRRGFLVRTSAAIVATSVELPFAERKAHAETTPIRRAGGARLRVALNAYSFARLLNDRLRGRGPGTSLFDLVDFCAREEIDGLDATGYFFHGYPARPTTRYVHELKRRAFLSGVGISGTGVRNHFTTADKAVRDESIQHVKEWVETAAQLGAPLLRVFADTQMKAATWETVAGGASRDAVEAWIADALRACAEQGEKFGVVIGVQNHGDFLKTSADHLSLIRRVDSPWCAPIVDTGYYKTPDPYADIAVMAPYAVSWQIKESPLGAGSDVRTDLVKLASIIRRAGYRGYVPIETLSAPGRDYDPWQIVPKFTAELRAAIDATASVTPPEDQPPAPLLPAAEIEPAKSRTGGKKP